MKKKTSVPCLDGIMSKEFESFTPPRPTFRRKMSDPDIHHGAQNINLLVSLLILRLLDIKFIS